MRTKSKIVVSVLSVVLCLGALVCGVWAAMTTITMPLTGSVSFDTNGVAVDINAYVEGSASSTNPYKFTHYSGAHLIDETLPDWDYGTVGFASKTEPVTFVFEVSNYATSQIRVGVEVTSESADYYAVQSPAYIAASTNGTTPTTGTATLTVNLDIGEYQTRLSATELTFNVVINEYTGDGSSQFNPIRISSAALWNSNVGVSNQYLELASDISGVTQNSLAAHLDGLGNTVTFSRNTALFSSISSTASLKNLVVTASSTISSFSGSNVGILANSISGSITGDPVLIQNVTINGKLNASATSNSSYAGAFAGTASYVKFAHCINNAGITVSASTSGSTSFLAVAGVAGYNTSTNQFLRCKNNGEVSVTGAVTQITAGGILGYASFSQTATGNQNNGVINVQQGATSNRSSMSVYVGGIAGNLYAAGSTVNYNANNANVVVVTGSTSTSISAAAGNHVGGIVGAIYGNSSTMVSYNYNLASATCMGSGDGAVQVGGIVGLSYGAGTRIVTNYASGGVGSTLLGSTEGRESLGGIVGCVNPNSTAMSSRQYVLGNYHLGSIEANAHSSETLTVMVAGIVGYVPTGYYCTIQANYNAGTLEVASSYSIDYPIAGIAAVSNASTITTSYISNNYYIDATTYGVYNLSNQTTSNTGCTSMTQANMQAASFVSTLNTACISAGFGVNTFSQSSSIQDGYPYFTEIGGPAILPAPEGSQENPYVVSDAASFQSVLTASTADTYIKVADGVTSLYVSQIPSFSGYFDGNGATISSSDNKALFGTITNATLKNFTIATAIPSQSTGTRMGTLAVTSENCYIDGIRVNIMSLSLNRSGSTENLSVGGLIGYDTGSTIVNCRIGDGATTPTISTTGGRTVYVGGVVGQCSGATKIYNTFVLMNIYKSTSANVFQAYALAYGRDVVANNCVFSGTITVSSLYYAYYVGSGTAANITNCYVDSASGVYTGISGLNYMSKTDMKASSFVTTLNANAAAITDIEGIRKWETSTSSHALPVPSGDLV